MCLMENWPLLIVAASSLMIVITDSMVLKQLMDKSSHAATSMSQQKFLECF